MDVENIKGKKVFIFEDDINLANMIQHFLEMRGLEVRHAEHPREGLMVIESFGPDIVITDINMPEIDGYSVFKQMQRRLPAVPIIAITAEHKLEKMFEIEGISAFIKKPFTLDELLNEIVKLL